MLAQQNPAMTLDNGLRSQIAEMSNLWKPSKLSYGNTYWCNKHGGCHAPGSIDLDKQRTANNQASLNGGSPIKQPYIICIFWGEEWNSQTNPSKPDMLRNFVLLQQLTSK
jgi:hypothetical protein